MNPGPPNHGSRCLCSTSAGSGLGRLTESRPSGAPGYPDAVPHPAGRAAGLRASTAAPSAVGGRRRDPDSAWGSADGRNQPHADQAESSALLLLFPTDQITVAIDSVDQFPGAAGREHRKRGRNNRNKVSQSWRPEAQNQGVSRATLPLKALGAGRGDLSSPLPASGGPWMPQRSIAPISASVVTWLLLGVCVHISVSL